MDTAKDKYFVYVGTYAEKTSPGIHIFTLDSASGALQAVDSVAQQIFAVLHPTGIETKVPKQVCLKIV